MTLFAGAYSIDKQWRVEDSLRRRLRTAISRHPANDVREFRWPHAYLVQADVGALGHSSLSESENGVVGAVGGQVLSDHRPVDNRQHEVRRLAEELVSGRRDSLQAARGTFCAVAYDPSSHRLVLAVDRLGVRPIYYWTDGNRVVFATAMRAIEALAGDLRLCMDPEAVAEICVFGYPLGGRTAVADARCLLPAEVVDFFDGRRRQSRWFRWDHVRERPSAGPSDLAELYEAFKEAVRLRLGSDRVSQAFLSGGLDSRAIVTELASRGTVIHSYNFSWADTYDRILGGEYARRVGSIHHEVPLSGNLTGEAWPRLMGETLATPRPVSDTLPERPRVVWAGDGGSVGLGRVYLDETMIESQRAGRIDEAVAEFLRRNSAAMPERFLRAQVRSLIADARVRGMVSELRGLECADPGKNLLVFLLENDQRRHLASYFEDLDVNRVEYMLPFFDAEFLTASVSFPLDATLKHRLYNRWLRLLPGPATEVPWQAYPGHEPCPLPLPAGFEHQWSARAGRTRRAALEEAGDHLRLLASRSFPSSMFSRARLLAAWLWARGGGGRFAYAFAALRVFARYHCVFQGRVGSTATLRGRDRDPLPES